MDPTLMTFAAVVLVAIATPGPTVLLALDNGSRLGIRCALYGMVGAIASDIVLISAVSIGLGAVLAASQLLFSVLKWAGVAYLCFLAFGMLKRESTQQAAMESGDAAIGSVAGRAVFLRSFLVAVTNPKGYLFFTAILPQFVDPLSGLAMQYVLLAAIFVSIDFAVMGAYALTGVKASNVLRVAGGRWMDRVCGSVFLALAAGLALYRR